jgi:hypothetical protein
MKIQTPKTGKAVLEKPQVKSNLKAALGKYKGVIVEKEGCWDADLKKTIVD